MRCESRYELGGRLVGRARGPATGAPRVWEVNARVDAQEETLRQVQQEQRQLREEVASVHHRLGGIEEIKQLLLSGTDFSFWCSSGTN